ncbi:colicin release lysis protein [Salmonella enterica]|nr:colicin release lysis protein [Salmonella enterica]EDQ2394345.1 lysis protein for colicin E6 [Salmonella enterica subsp. enterica]EDY1998406.1 lysis protein for colicin E6 [Salmonella enterica subsp. diarizonae]EEE1295596.1 lysis protein for colicin E6 [Salmonella enterica subsp. diarizonae]EEN5590995.1 lysis protein for colicin E6 [Salmonella enterica subsp. enterica serovar Mountpleasant]
MKSYFLVTVIIFFLSGCQANYIRDVQGGTVAPSSTSTLTGIEEH